MAKYTTDWAGTMKVGPNDVRCVFWALGESFFFDLLSFKFYDIYRL